MSEYDEQNGEGLNGEQGEVEQPLSEDEIILGSDGQPINVKKAIEIATQQGQNGKVVLDNGTLVHRSQALRMALDQNAETLVKQLEAGVTENTEQFFRFFSRVYKYSPRNTMLLYLQDPSCTFVQSYSGWTSHGYRLKSKKEGATALFVIQPRPTEIGRLVDEEGNTVEKLKKVIFYRAVAVYDRKSIDEEFKPVPDFFIPMEGDASALAERLTQILVEDGASVMDEYPLTLSAQGETDGKVIRLRPDLREKSVNRLGVLIHEATHFWLHFNDNRKELSKEVKELHAEVASFLLMSHYNLPTVISADYLRMYGIDKAMLQANFAITKDIVHRTIERMEQGYNEELKAEFAYDAEKANASRREYKPSKRGGFKKKRR